MAVVSWKLGSLFCRSIFPEMAAICKEWLGMSVALYDKTHKNGSESGFHGIQDSSINTTSIIEHPFMLPWSKNKAVAQTMLDFILSKWTLQTKMSNVPLNLPQEIRTTKISSDNPPKKIQFLPCLFLGKKSINMFFSSCLMSDFPTSIPRRWMYGIFLPTFGYFNAN